MPEYFAWSDTDPYVKSVLTKEEIDKVGFWSKEEYEFSIHDGHEGWPLYVVPPGKRGKQPMPKIFLAPASYNGVLHDKGGWLAGQRAVKTGSSIQADAKNVVAKNLELFRKIAKNYYPEEAEKGGNSNGSVKKGEVVTADTQTTPNTVSTLLECQKCGAKLDKAKNQPTDMEGKMYKCPKCNKPVYAK